MQALRAVSKYITVGKGKYHESQLNHTCMYVYIPVVSSPESAAALS